MARARIIAARRTAICPSGGAFAALSLEELASPVIAALLADARLSPGQVDGLIAGNALGAGGNPARRLALAAGLPGVAGLTIDRQCTSGLDAILLAKAMVEAGQARLVIAGGVESHSRRPHRAHRGPAGPVPYEQAPFTPWPDRDPDMAAAADALGIARADQDLWAIQSHEKALARGTMAEIVPLLGQESDAFARALTPQIAARAKVVSGTITAANAAVAADGAAFVLVAADDIARGEGLDFTGISLGGDPEAPALAPIAAIKALLAREGVQAGDLERVELMEAYAAQAIACTRGAALPAARINLGGGALARGHPIGASGAVLATRLFADMGAGPALAAIAGAGGIGTAVLFRR